LTSAPKKYLQNAEKRKPLVESQRLLAAVAHKGPLLRNAAAMVGGAVTEPNMKESPIVKVAFDEVKGLVPFSETQGH
jgi:hypothetical protein